MNSCTAEYSNIARHLDDRFEAVWQILLPACSAVRLRMQKERIIKIGLHLSKLTQKILHVGVLVI